MRRSMLSLAAGLSLIGLYALGQQQDPKKKPARREEPIVPAAALPVVEGVGLSDGKSYDNQPAACTTADGTTVVAWVRYRNRGADELVAAAVKGGRAEAAVAITPEKGQYIRPALAAAGADAWCVWTKTEPDHVSTIWVSRRSAEGWSSPRRLVPDETRAHQNPEIAATADGKAAVAYQVHTGRGYDIHLRTFDGKAWGEPQALSGDATNDWDPSLAFDAKGGLHVVWTEFRDGDYDVVLCRPGMPTRRLSARGEYDLHPWVAAGPDGRVWVTWDVVRIPNHGYSGTTTITGANRTKVKVDEDHGRKGVISEIEVRVLDGEAAKVPGRPREELAAPKGYKIAHCGVPKVAVGPGGEPWIFHRVLRRDASSPGIGYFWELLGRPFRDGAWSEAVRFAKGDGYLEEPGVAVGPDGFRVAYSGESRQMHIPKTGAKKPAPPVSDDIEAHDHHRDFDRLKGWVGEIQIAVVGDPAAKGPETLADAPPPADRPLPPRPRMEPYSTVVGGKTYKLLFGDTHRHSNVSRCSQGNEPSPDDLYRYGTDVCRYDWFALSDHAEDPRLTGYDVIDGWWWKQQKLADLYHVPGAMSVLYNYEWSLSYPHGHHNTIFPSRPKLRLDRSLAQSSTLAGGWKLLEKEGQKAITIPHTGADPGMGTAWEVQDDRYQRLCEIFQACRGSYEHDGCPREYTQTSNKKGYYWNALEKGYKVGVIASTDHGFGVSYACVYAPANDRESIWQALWDRRTYGSTTYGLVLEFRSGERWMGEEFASADAPPLDVYVRGSAPIRSIEIIGRSKVLHAVGSQAAPLNVAEHRLRWTDPDWAAQTNEQWYYVRVIQVDDEMAWSSPVWVKRP